MKLTRLQLILALATFLLTPTAITGCSVDSHESLIAQWEELIVHADVAKRVQDYKEAEQLLLRAVAEARRITKNENRQILSLIRLANTQEMLKKFSDAASNYEEAWLIYNRRDHAKGLSASDKTVAHAIAIALTRLGTIYQCLGRRDSSLKTYLNAEKMYESALKQKAGMSVLINYLNNLTGMAECYLAAGDSAQATRTLKTAIAVVRTYQIEDIFTESLAASLRRLKSSQINENESSLQDSELESKRNVHEWDVRLASVLHSNASDPIVTERALASLVQEAESQNFPPDRLPNVLSQLGLVEQEQHQYERSGKHFAEASQLMKDRQIDNLEISCNIACGSAKNFLRLERLSEAEKHCKECVALMAERLGENKKRTLRYKALLAKIYKANKKYSEAERSLCDVTAALSQFYPNEDQRQAEAWKELAEVYAATGKWGDAESALTKTFLHLRHAGATNDPLIAPALSLYRQVVKSRGRKPAARTVLDETQGYLKSL